MVTVDELLPREEVGHGVSNLGEQGLLAVSELLEHERFT